MTGPDHTGTEAMISSDSSLNSKSSCEGLGQNGAMM